MKASDVLLEALPYINRFRGRTFVIKIGGELIAREEHLHALADDVTVLQRVGVRIVVVHGGGPQADHLSHKLGVKPMMVGGRRVTDDETLEVVKMVFAGKINTEILSALRRSGAHAVGLSGLAGGIVMARRRGIKKFVDPDTGEVTDVDYGHVGDVVKIDTHLLEVLIREDYIPVLSCLGADEQGHIYNINADTIAAEVAISMRAEKLLCMTNVPGLMRTVGDPDSVVRELTLPQARAVLRKRWVSRGMIPKLTALIAAVAGGVARAHMLDGGCPHTLLAETFTPEGAGTMVVASREMRRYKSEG